MAGKAKSVEALADLTPDPRNARRHTDRNVGMIRDALAEVGAARSIVIDERGVILAGNATAKAATEAGLKLQVIDADGDSIVAVRRSNLTAKQKTRLALFDNRAAEEAEWDVDVLSGLNDDGLLDGMWSAEELDALLTVPEEIAPGDGGDDFDCTPEEGPTRCQPGDLWRLGEHRLLCGDSTKAEDVARVLGDAVPLLMVTDPPYGVDYDPTWRDEAGGQFGDGKTVMRGKVLNDDRVDWSPAWALFPGNVSYVWHAGIYAGEVAVSLVSAGFLVRAQVVWRKPHFIMGRGAYHWQHEPCWYAVRKGATAKWCGDRSQSTIWDIAGMNPAGGNREEKLGHGTQKPLECMARPIRNHEGDVYDPFLGSGTTLIAAERLGRKCYGIEISPKYCDVILRRWEAETGKTAERVA